MNSLAEHDEISETGRFVVIGIRMALGSKRGGVIAMIMRGAMIQTFLGLAIGIPVALLGVRFVKSQLYETTNADARRRGRC